MKPSKVILLATFTFLFHLHAYTQSVFIGDESSKMGLETSMVLDKFHSSISISPHYTFKGFITPMIQFGYISSRNSDLSGYLIAPRLEVLIRKVNSEQRLGIGIEGTYRRFRYVRSGSQFSAINSGIVKGNLYSLIEIANQAKLYPQISVGWLTNNIFSQASRSVFLFGIGGCLIYRDTYLKLIADLGKSNSTFRVSLGTFF